MGFVPQFVDMNGDGLKDMISGSFIGDAPQREGFDINAEKQEPARYPDGSIASEVFIYYQQKDGTFVRRIRLALCHRHSVVTPVDWDDDGDIDLISANYYVFDEKKRGTLLNLLENTGTATSPWFTQPQPLLNGVNGLPSSYTCGFAYDWDKDGDLDLLAAARGASGSIVFLERITKEADGRMFKDPVSLIPESIRESENHKKWCDVFTLSVVDWDGDGVEDILASSNWRERWTEERLLAERSDEEIESYHTAKKKLAEMQERLKETRPQGSPRDWSDEEKATYLKKMNTILFQYKEYSTLIGTKFKDMFSHGYVWVFRGVRD